MPTTSGSALPARLAPQTPDAPLTAVEQALAAALAAAVLAEAASDVTRPCQRPGRVTAPMAGLDAGELLALPFLTIRSAACALGLSPEGVRRAIQTGRLAAVRLKGGKWRIAADDVRAWIAARKTRAAR